MAKTKTRGRKLTDQAKATWLIRELISSRTPFRVEWVNDRSQLCTLITTVDPNHDYVIEEMLSRPTTTETVSVDEAVEKIKEAIETACDDVDCLRQIILEQYPMDSGRAVIDAEISDDNEEVTLHYEVINEVDPDPKTIPIKAEPEVRKAG